MHIDTNIAGVVGRLQRFMGGLDGAVAVAVSAGRWERVLRNVARVALDGEAGSRVEEGEWRGMIPAFVQAVMVEALGSGNGDGGGESGFTAALRGPEASTGTIGGAQEIMRGGDGRRRLEPGQAEIVGLAREGIQDWVRAEKRKTAVDAAYSDEEIADRLAFILFSRRPTAAMVDAAEGLTARIERYLAAQHGVAMPAEMVSRWLRAVLAAWRQAVVSQLPAVARQEIARLARRSGEEML